MTILDRYILKQALVNFGFGVTLFVTILTAGDLLFRLTRLWLQTGLAFGTVLRVFFYSIPSFLIYVLPMAVLLAVLLTTSRLAAGSEVIALKASGISLKRVTLPFFLLALWACTGTVILSEWALPASVVRLQEVVGEESAMPDWLVQENTFFTDTSVPGMERVFYVKRIDRERDLLHDVIVQEFDQGSLTRIINAEQAFIGADQWIFLNGVYYEMDEQGRVERVVRYQREVVSTTQTMTEMIEARRKPQEMSFAELSDFIEREGERGQHTVPMEVMLWQKTAIPFACLVFALLGVPLGVTSPRAGKSVGIGISILIVFGYYVFFSLSGALAEGGTINPFFGAWFGNFIGIAAGVILLWVKDSH